VPADIENPRGAADRADEVDTAPAPEVPVTVEGAATLAVGAEAVTPISGTVDALIGPPAAAGPDRSAAPTPRQDLDDLKAIIEALVFASPDPLTPKTLFKLLDSEPQEDVEAALAALRSEYEHRGGLQFVEVAGGYQIVTRPELHEWVRRLFHERRSQKLSVQALETLAVVAYKQPITAPEIAEIRGVNATGVLATLLERHLVKIAGRKQVVGRPFLYATTREFLIRFGLRDLSDLPKMEDMADVLGFDLPTRLAAGGPVEARLPLEPEETMAEALVPDDGTTGHVH
jgi:segregation and condensation protein B